MGRRERVARAATTALASIVALAIGGESLLAQRRAIPGAVPSSTSTAAKPAVSPSATISRAAATAALSQLQQRRMPNLVDSTESFARAILSRLRVSVTVTTRDTTNAALDGRVFAQSPPAGTPLTLASVPTVDLGVYRYVPATTVTVPDVTRRPVAIAVRLLQRARLTPRVPRAVGVATAVAIVADQIPKGGTTASAGDTVTLIVDITTRVPHVVGLDLPTATRLLISRELVIAQDGSEYSDDIPPGRIVRQHPDSGVVARPASTVSVWTSLGAAPPAPTLVMPPLTGLTLGEADTALRRLKLAVTHVDSVSDRLRAGRIVAQDPGAGYAVRPRDAVSVTVGVAPLDHVVPWVVGRAWEEGAATLKDSSFVARLRLAPGDGVSPGVVMRQSVDSGQRRPAGTAILLTVASTPEPPPPTSQVMPDVVGRPRETAIDTLGFLSPRLTIVEEVVTTRGDSGRVTAQEPAAGAIVFPPVDVVLRVGRYQRPPPPDSAAAGGAGGDTTSRDSTIVPDVVGLTLQEARDALARSRLALGEVTSDHLALDSVVSAQTPTAGTPAAIGVAVGVVLRRQDADTGNIDFVVPPPPEFPRWPFVLLIGGIAAAVVIARARAKKRRDEAKDASTRPKRRDDDDRKPPRVSVTLRESQAGPPVVELPPDESLVHLEVSLIDLAPEIEIELPGTLIAREEEHDGR